MLQSTTSVPQHSHCKTCLPFPLPCCCSTVARHRGWVAAVVIAWRSLRALRRLLSAFIAPDLIMRQVAAVVVLQTV